MTKKRFATMATCIALVGAVAVGGTLALLASESKQLTNTFTVGNNYESGDFLLKEHDVTQTTSGANVGDYTNTAVETQTGVTYGNVIANSDLAKDPFFELVKGKKASTKGPDDLDDYDYGEDDEEYEDGLADDEDEDGEDNGT